MDEPPAEDELVLTAVAEAPDFVKRQTREGHRLEPVKGVEVRLPERPEAASPAETASDTKIPRKLDTVELRMAGFKRYMDDAEEKYLVAYKEFVRERRKADREMTVRPEESYELLALKAEFDKARIEYAEKLEEDAGQRMLQGMANESAYKQSLKTDRPDSALLNPEKVMARYKSLVRHRETVKNPAKRKIDAEYEVLDAEGKKAYVKALTWIGRQNGKAEVKLGKNVARAVKAALAAAAVSGVAAFSGAAALAVIGFGTWKFGRALVSSIVGGAAAEGAAKGVDTEVLSWHRGKEQKTRREFAASGQELSVEALKELDAKQERVVRKTSERSRATRKMIVRAFTGFGFGMSTSEILASLPSTDGLIGSIIGDETVQGSDATHAETEQALRSGVQEVERVQSTPRPRLGYENVPLDGRPTIDGHPVEQSAVAAPEATHSGTPWVTEARQGSPGMIDESGEGTDRAFREMQDHLRSTMTGQQLANASPALKHFLDSNPNAISQEMGEAYGVRGIVTQPGDRFSFDEQGRNLYFERDGQRQLFLESRNGEVVQHDIRAESLRSVGNPAPVSAQVPAHIESRGAEPLVQETPVRAQESATSAESAQERNSPDLGTELTDTTTRTPSQNSGGVQGLDEFVASQSGTPNAVEHIVTPEPPPTTAGQGTPQGIQSLDNWVDQNRPQQAPTEAPAEAPATAERLSWTHGQGLPQERSLFAAEQSLISKLAIPNLKGDILYAHADTPRLALDFAQEQGRLNPGVNIAYDSSEYDIFGAKTPKISIIRYGDNGYPQEFIKDVVDRNGDPVTSITPDQLRERIA